MTHNHVRLLHAVRSVARRPILLETSNFNSAVVTQRNYDLPFNNLFAVLHNLKVHLYTFVLV